MTIRQANRIAHFAWRMTEVQINRGLEIRAYIWASIAFDFNIRAWRILAK